MRWIYAIGLFFLFSGVGTAAEINVWDTPAKRLGKLLRGQTREDALYQITSVSSQDKTVEAADGTRYALVQYGRGEDMRHLLFQAEEPQTFIACAVTPEQTRTLIEKYQIHLGFNEKEFLALFEQPAPFYTSANRTIYRVGNPGFFLLFEYGQPTRTLTQPQAEEFIKKQQAAATPKPAAVPTKKPTRWKALVNGGTTYEQIYLPHVVPSVNTQTEKSAPSKL